MAAERARLERAAEEEPDTRMEASLVFARPFDRDAILGLQSALGADLRSLIAAGKVGESFYSSDYDLALLPGDLAAKLAAVEERHRTGMLPTPRRLLGARVVSESGASSLPLPGGDAPARDRVLLRELERDPRILAVKLRASAP